MKRLSKDEMRMVMGGGGCYEIGGHGGHHSCWYAPQTAMETVYAKEFIQMIQSVRPDRFHVMKAV